MQMSRIQFRFKNSQRQNNSFEEFFGPRDHVSRSEARMVHRNALRMKENQKYDSYLKATDARNKEYGDIFGNEKPMSRGEWTAYRKDIETQKTQRR